MLRTLPPLVALLACACTGPTVHDAPPRWLTTGRPPGLSPESHLFAVGCGPTAALAADVAAARVAMTLQGLAQAHVTVADLPLPAPPVSIETREVWPDGLAFCALSAMDRADGAEAVGERLAALDERLHSRLEAGKASRDPVERVRHAAATARLAWLRHALAAQAQALGAAPPPAPAAPEDAAGAYRTEVEGLAVAVTTVGPLASALETALAQAVADCGVPVASQDAPRPLRVEAELTLEAVPPDSGQRTLTWIFRVRAINAVSRQTILSTHVSDRAPVQAAAHHALARLQQTAVPEFAQDFCAWWSQSFPALPEPPTPNPDPRTPNPEP